MGKNIIVCLDGTGNQFEEHNSNVVKLFRVIKRDSSQVAYYDPGVGTLADPAYKTTVAKKVNKLFGLAFGQGLTRNVMEAYSFLMDNFEQGDRLFLFGFSRGAYTARVLAGFIHGCGLLEPGCQNLIPYAMKIYKTKPVNFKTMSLFKSTFGRDVKVDFLGLWDSVSTIGWIYNPVFLPYTTNNEGIQIVRHALAIDEKRSFFQEMRWGKEYASNQNIKEVWFPGVHSDIGGGYSEQESELAKISLAWMITEAIGPHTIPSDNSQQLSLKISQHNFDRYVLGKNTSKYVGPNSNADRHESLKGLWKLVQWIPRSVWLVKEGRAAIRRPPAYRTLEAGDTLHQSVLERMKKRDYHPPNLHGRSIDEIAREFKLEPA